MFFIKLSKLKHKNCLNPSRISNSNLESADRDYTKDSELLRRLKKNELPRTRVVQWRSVLIVT